jgi:hypothetical protein
MNSETYRYFCAFDIIIDYSTREFGGTHKIVNPREFSCTKIVNLDFEIQNDDDLLSMLQIIKKSYSFPTSARFEIKSLSKI